MEFDKLLTGKILDPIHGIIRLTKLELQFVDHALFQRLRNIKQNTFLYKVFPSAMHSRFEHSLGVMHLSYEILKNLKLNSYRYQSKYKDGHIFDGIDSLSLANIQELRLAALLHDIGHGPMSHQFDSFMCQKEDLEVHLGDDFCDVFDMIKDGSNIEHEHISIIFVKIIYNSLDEKYREQINIDNVMKIIEGEYKDKEIMVNLNAGVLDILPLFTSVISSCPIDADRMDYLLRDSYFSGVKCGVYDYNRLFMSIVPVINGNKVYLAYKESGIDSVVEFINSRASLFGQVYYHKTNRAFSAMLGNVCDIAKKNKSGEGLNLFTFYEPDSANPESKSEQLESFYIKNSDDYFLHEQLPEFVFDSENPGIGEAILADIINRVPWSKEYESKIYPKNLKIVDAVNKDFTSTLKDELFTLISSHLPSYMFAIDIMTDNAFKDIDKTEIKLLGKDLSGGYEINKFSDSGDKLDKYQSIKYFIRVFVSDSFKSNVTHELIEEIEKKKSELVTKFFGE
ncbi:HD domain-containing protein [Shewanella salipaludis]|uniref:HD domain-containing protein n=1 Tax=Shewanella salipaludis TaxID=2723052 RepID=A0A972G179_9GAMM|nr:HD domain-containing protein [Shewanella salipaludis]NMH65656.1 HD domain-containing protein [Shewanella salipaludis]